MPTVPRSRAATRERSAKITKTTVNLPTALLDEARRMADRSGLTLKDLVESGLRREIEVREESPSPRPTYQRQTFGGRGLRKEFSGLSMHRIVHMSYGLDRGGEE